MAGDKPLAEPFGARYIAEPRGLLLPLSTITLLVSGERECFKGEQVNRGTNTPLLQGVLLELCTVLSVLTRASQLCIPHCVLPSSL